EPHEAALATGSAEATGRQQVRPDRDGRARRDDRSASRVDGAPSLHGSGPTAGRVDLSHSRARDAAERGKHLRSPNAIATIARAHARAAGRSDREDRQRVTLYRIERLDSGLFYDRVGRKSGMRSKVPARAFLEASPSQSSRTVA